MKLQTPAAVLLTPRSATTSINLARVLRPQMAPEGRWAASTKYPNNPNKLSPERHVLTLCELNTPRDEQSATRPRLNRMQSKLCSSRVAGSYERGCAVPGVSTERCFSSGERYRAWRCSRRHSDQTVQPARPPHLFPEACQRPARQKRPPSPAHSRSVRPCRRR